MKTKIITPAVFTLFWFLVSACANNDSRNTYTPIMIETQAWMSSNLNVSVFRNGDPVPEARTDEEWRKAGQDGNPAWCYYDNKTENGSRYGRLYNWYAVNDKRGLAPAGWHISSDAEWRSTTDFLGGRMQPEQR